MTYVMRGSLAAVLVLLFLAVAMSPTLAAKTCPKCGRHYADSDNFCDRDGSSLVKVALAKKASPKPKPATPTPKKEPVKTKPPAAAPRKQPVKPKPVKQVTKPVRQARIVKPRPVKPAATRPVVTRPKPSAPKPPPEKLSPAESRVTRGELAQIIDNAMPFLRSPGNNAAPYTDVSPKDQYYEAICYMTGSGCMMGFPDGTFQPQGKITRYELTVLLDRLVGAAESKLGVTFKTTGRAYRPTDVPADHWASDAVIKMYALGVFPNATSPEFRGRACATVSDAKRWVNRLGEIASSLRKE